MSRLGILAFGGTLPRIIAQSHPRALYAVFEGETRDAPEGQEMAIVSYERWGEMFRILAGAGVSEVVMAGHLTRPSLDPDRLDARTRQIAPQLMHGMTQGDDGLLRVVIALFEAEGFAVRGAHELVPDLMAEPGLLAGPAPTEADLADIAQARALLAALAPHDVGQAAVVVRGLCLGLETAQGTDAMLRFAAEAPEHLRGGGVLVKEPKPGQDLRVDMPAIGPATVAGAVGAGLSGIAVAAGGVMILDRAETLAAAKAAGLFVLAQAP